MLGKRLSLAAQLAETLADRIAAGFYKPGQRIPTEQELCAEYGVSRTVVREAVASLRADDLVVVRHGVGVFVSDAPASRPFRIPAADPGTLSEIVDILELRLSLEVEAAALAAQRRSQPELDAIWSSYDGIEREFEAEAGNRGRADFEFHVAIARATGNSHFSKLLGYLGQYIIPRFRLGRDRAGDASERHYHDRIQKEHRRIAEAIADQSPGAARSAMRRHLATALAHYRALAERSG